LVKLVGLVQLGQEEEMDLKDQWENQERPEIWVCLAWLARLVLLDLQDLQDHPAKARSLQLQ